MTTLLKLVRVRLRLAVKVSARVADFLDLLGFVFLAQLVRVVLFAALAGLLLLDLLVRASLRLTVLSFRLVRTRVLDLVKLVAASYLVALLLLPVANTELDKQLFNLQDGVWLERALKKIVAVI